MDISAETIVIRHYLAFLYEMIGIPPVSPGAVLFSFYGPNVEADDRADGLKELLPGNFQLAKDL